MRFDFQTSQFILCEGRDSTPKSTLDEHQLNTESRDLLASLPPWALCIRK